MSSWKANRSSRSGGDSSWRNKKNWYENEKWQSNAAPEKWQSNAWSSHQWKNQEESEDERPWSEPEYEERSKDRRRKAPSSVEAPTSSGRWVGNVYIAPNAQGTSVGSKTHTVIEIEGPFFNGIPPEFYAKASDRCRQNMAKHC